MNESENKVNLAEIARLHAVNDRLRTEIERLRSQPCPYVTGNVTHYCTLTPLTLTDEEREAVASAIRWCEIDAPADGDVVSRYCAARASTLRGLLERTDTGEK
jgi:hypothetical protein